MSWMNLINLLITTLGPLWLIYRFYQKRNALMLIGAVLIFTFGLRNWPVYLSLNLTLASIGFFASIYALITYFKNRKDKLYLGLGLILFLFTCAFAAEWVFAKENRHLIVKHKSVQKTKNRS